MKLITKIILCLVSILICVALIYTVIESFVPRTFSFQGAINDKNINSSIQKTKENDKYYISFCQNENLDKTIKIECTKQQYDFIVNGKQYHILCKRNFFNRKSGKILQLDDKPIYNGHLQVALA